MTSSSIALPATIFTIEPYVFGVPVQARALTDLGITVYLAEITPAVAETLLKRKHVNRIQRRKMLALLRRALESGGWEINGETIICDAEGRLIDGEHRIRSIHDTGITAWSLVVHGIDQEYFKTIDQGTKRGVGDILGMRGEKSGRSLGAALRWVWRYEHGQMTVKEPIVTEYEIADMLEVHGEIINSMPIARGAEERLHPALAIALHYLFHRQDAYLANHFFHRLADGSNLDKGNPILTLRETLMTVLKKAPQMGDDTKAVGVIEIWNTLRKDVSAQILKIQWGRWEKKKLEFPQIV